jgi:hypothetical protein
VWRACERLGVLPPGVKQEFDDCPVMIQAAIVGFNQIREHEDAEFDASLAGAKLGGSF